MKIKVSEFNNIQNPNSVDKELFEQGCSFVFSDAWKIKNNTVLDNDIVEMLIDFSKRGLKVNQLFTEGSFCGTSYQYKLEVVCSECGIKHYVVMTKTALLKYLQNSDTYICEDCDKRIKNQKAQFQKAERERMVEENNKIREQNTEYYINTYLDPNKEWCIGVSAKTKFKEAVSSQFVNWDNIAEAIKSMSYQDFLQTPYWKAIAQKKKEQQHYKCQLCAGNKMLATHHKTYEHHGHEHEYKVMENDLIVLCDSCHKKFHNILED